MVPDVPQINLILLFLIFALGFFVGTDLPNCTLLECGCVQLNTAVIYRLFGLLRAEVEEFKSFMSAWRSTMTFLDVCWLASEFLIHFGIFNTLFCQILAFQPHLSVVCHCCELHCVFKFNLDVIFNCVNFEELFWCLTSQPVLNHFGIVWRL